MVRRKLGTLLPLEIEILSGGLMLQARGGQHFHGFALAKEIAEQGRARSLTAYGTLYRALDRLAQMGLVEAIWEDPQIAAEEQRPRRRLYRVTPDGKNALHSILREQGTAVFALVRS
jgi:PadR family transcriptional regulator PadR